MPQVKSVALPVEVVEALLNFASRGQLTRDEWRFLETWEQNINQSIQQASAAKVEPKADAKPETPFDPTTEAAAKKREQRAAKRKADAHKKTVSQNNNEKEMVNKAE